MPQPFQLVIIVLRLTLDRFNLASSLRARAFGRSLLEARYLEYPGIPRPSCLKYRKTTLFENPTGSTSHHTAHNTKPEMMMPANVFVSIDSRCWRGLSRSFRLIPPVKLRFNGTLALSCQTDPRYC